MNDLIIWFVLLACIACIAFGLVWLFSAILAERDRRQLAALRAACVVASAQQGVGRA